MHDPLIVAFEIKRPWPETCRARDNDGIPATPHRYWPALITVWHREPNGHDAGTVCNWRRMAWHVHHWKLQVHPLQDLRRRLLTRCTWCGGPSRKHDVVNHALQWGDGPRARWWRGELDLYHGDCGSVAIAHRTCVCEQPALKYGSYGTCSACGKSRPHGATTERLERLRALQKLPTGTRPPRPHAERNAQ